MRARTSESPARSAILDRSLPPPSSFGTSGSVRTAEGRVQPRAERRAPDGSRFHSWLASLYVLSFAGLIGVSLLGASLLPVLATAIRADRGTARIEGKDARIEPQEVGQRIALLSHQTYLYDSLTALENLQVAASFLGRDAGRVALLRLLEEVGLADRADDPAATFSAGMRKRLSLWAPQGCRHRGRSTRP